MCGKTQCVRPAQTRLQNSGVTGPSSSYLYGTDLKCSQQCIFAYKKAIRVMGMIRRTISYKEPKIMLSLYKTCLLYTSPSPRDGLLSRMPSSAWKKYLAICLVHRVLTSLHVWPLVPLLFLSKIKRLWSEILLNPLNILKTSIRTCLFLLSYKVQSLKHHNLSSYILPFISFIIFVNLRCILSNNSLYFM